MVRLRVLICLLVIGSLAIEAQTPATTAISPAQTLTQQQAPQSPVLQPPAQLNAAKSQAAPPSVFWWIFSVSTIIMLGGLAIVANLLRNDRDWTFADAMSGPDGKPSASRIIAFLGFLAIIGVVVGVGYSTLWIFLATGQLPTLSGATTFLVACSGLFAPYLANQVGLAVAGQSNTPQSLAPVVIQSANSAMNFGQSVTPSVTFGSPMRPPIG